MNIQILKSCTTPQGRHSPGEVVEVETAAAEYLIEHGYAKPPGAKVETASAPMDEVESATMAGRKTGRPKMK